MTQVKKKFILNDAVDGAKVRYLNDQTFRANDAGGNAVDLFKLDSSDVFQLLSLPRVSSGPSDDNDVVRKLYVDDADGLIQGELDDTQTGAGLDSNGSYIVPTGTTYLDASTSLADATLKLDVAVNDAVQNNAKERFVLSGTDITNQYIDLAHEAIANSLMAYVDRLAIHEGASEDYTLSVVAGKTRISFANAIATGGLEALEAGDVINVKYTYANGN